MDFFSFLFFVKPHNFNLPSTPHAIHYSLSSKHSTVSTYNLSQRFSVFLLPRRTARMKSACAKHLKNDFHVRETLEKWLPHFHIRNRWRWSASRCGYFAASHTHRTVGRENAKTGLDALKITPTRNQTPNLDRPICGLVTVQTELSRHQRRQSTTQTLRSKNSCLNPARKLSRQ